MTLRERRPCGENSAQVGGAYLIVLVFARHVLICKYCVFKRNSHATEWAIKRKKRNHLANTRFRLGACKSTKEPRAGGLSHQYYYVLFLMLHCAPLHVVDVYMPIYIAWNSCEWNKKEPTPNKQNKHQLEFGPFVVFVSLFVHHFCFHSSVPHQFSGNRPPMRIFKTLVLIMCGTDSAGNIFEKGNNKNIFELRKCWNE